MPESLKRDRIYLDIRTGIISGRHPALSKLPTEEELSERYEAARGTVRQALKKLEMEGYLSRYKRRGTYVCQRICESSQRVLTFLVPHLEYIRNRNSTLRSWLYAIIEAGSRHSWRVETVVYSRTNNPNDIDWEALQHLNQDSRVIVLGHWFSPFFPFLQRCKARVAYLRSYSWQPTEWDEYLDNWLNIIDRGEDAALQAVQRLQTAGCRRIACLVNKFTDRYNPVAAGYREAIRRRNLPQISLPESDEQKFSVAVADLYQCTPFDACIVVFPEDQLQPSLNFHQNLGIPESVRIIAFPTEITSYYRKVSPPISTLQPQLSVKTEDLVKELISDVYCPKKLYYEYLFDEKESSLPYQKEDSAKRNSKTTG